MREIKFRVWDNVDCMSGSITLQDLQDGRIQFTSDCPVMQFTGLHDKDGKEIYEGDIFEELGLHGYVKWLGCGFVIEWLADCYCDLLGWENWERGKLHDGKTYEVIGNIYENPDLLTGGSSLK